MSVMEATEERSGGLDRVAIGDHRWHAARRVAAVLVFAMALAAPRVASAEPPQYANDLGLGLGAVLVDVVYMPAKVVYATLGGITGCFAFVLTGGRMDIASSVWRPSLGGTYVVTPSMLRGDEPINFSGGGSDESERPRDEDRPAPREEPLHERDHSGRGESY